MNIDTSKHQRALPESEYQFLMGLVTIDKDLKLITSLLLDFMIQELKTKQEWKPGIELPPLHYGSYMAIIENLTKFALSRGYELKFGENRVGDICRICIIGIERV